VRLTEAGCIWSAARCLYQGRLVWPGQQQGSQLLDSAQRRSLAALLLQASSVPIKNFNFKRIGEDVSEKLDYTPGVFVGERRMRNKGVKRV
jgi:transposase